MMRRSATAVIERNITWAGPFATEPWEAPWASEALFFVRQLDDSGASRNTTLTARVQISPDGIRWVDEGHELVLRGDEEMTFVRVREFGGWLRLAGQVEAGSARVIVYLSLKE
jgi:hypothetical protein